MGQKVTTELTSKPIKLALLIFSLGFVASGLGVIFGGDDLRIWFVVGGLISMVGLFTTRIVRWWVNG
jgi:hypothetical protein